MCVCTCTMEVAGHLKTCRCSRGYVGHLVFCSLCQTPQRAGTSVSAEGHVNKHVKNTDFLSVLLEFIHTFQKVNNSAPVSYIVPVIIDQMFCM